MKQKIKWLLSISIALYALLFATIAYGSDIETGAVAASDLIVSATLPPNPLDPSASFTSVFTVSNIGDAASAPGTVTVSYANGNTLNGVSRLFTLSAGIICSGYTPRYGNIRKTCYIPAIDPGASIDIATYSATGPANVPAAGVNTTAYLTGPTNSVTISWQWRTAGLADISAIISTSPNPVIIGRSARAYVYMTNSGFSAANGFNTHVSVPGTVTSITSGTAPDALCRFTGGEVDCETTIRNGGWQSLSIVYDAPTVAGTYSTMVSADSNNIIVESNEGNNIGTGNVIVTEAVVRLHSSSVNPVEVTALTAFTRTVTVSNDGTDDALNVSFTNRQTETRFISSDGPTGTTCNAYYVTVRFNQRMYAGTQCSIGTLAVGASVSINIRLSAPSGSSVPVTLTDYVQVNTTSFQDPINVSSSQGSFLLVQANGPVAPTNTVVPTISGNANTGSTLTTTNGIWIGTSPFTYSYQWQHCDAVGNACSDIGGATASTYLVPSSDAGMTLRSFVTAANGGGNMSIPSVVSAVVIDAAPPANTVAPTLVPGLEKQPGFLWSVTNGTWSGTPTITYTYQWQRCDLNGENCVNIADATNQYYVLQVVDVFNQVRVQVTASNSGGTATADSDLSGEIDPAD